VHPVLRIARQRTDQRCALWSVSEFELDLLDDVIHMQRFPGGLKNGVSTTGIGVRIEKPFLRVASYGDADVLPRASPFADSSEQHASALESLNVFLATLDIFLKPRYRRPLCCDGVVNVAHPIHDPF